ncbi:MAG: hypothetical protein ACYDH6_00815 [Acidimicrobiales bacterium]
MHRLAKLGLTVCALTLASCSSSGSKQTVTAQPSVPSTSTSTTVAPLPHFDTPEAAMTYLAAAWNANDLVSLRHVTNPAARAQLDAMHSEAINLRLDHCTKRPEGDYECTFRHDYPAATPTTMPGGVGEAAFLVGPADTPGWYMTVFEHCG